MLNRKLHFLSAILSFSSDINEFFFEAEHGFSMKGAARHPFKCRCLRTKPALQHGITTTVGANLQPSHLYKTLKNIGIKYNLMS